MNRIELVLFLLIIGSSAIGWVVRQLKEKAHQRQTLLNRERERQEALRTGRNLETAQVGPGAQPAAGESPPRALTPEERLREIMLERQRRLEELRRRAVAQAQARARAAQARTGASPAARPATRPTPTRPASTPAPQRGAITLNTSDGAYATENQRREQIARKRTEDQRIGAAARAKQERFDLVESERTTRERAASDIADATRRGQPVPSALRDDASRTARLPTISGAAAFSPAELRRAVVMNEVFSPPVALRADA